MSTASAGRTMGTYKLEAHNEHIAENEEAKAAYIIENRKKVRADYR